MKQVSRFISSYLFIYLILSLIFTTKILSQNPKVTDTSWYNSISEETQKNEKKFKMTTLTFGGNGISITGINNQLTIMTGGRGSATFNNRYTIGGGGWGMTKGVETGSITEGVYNFVKMGYGGIDFGYLLYTGKKFNVGTKVLLGAGAVFMETVPESKNNSLKIFPVFEPAIYYQISLSKLFRFEMRSGYRLIRGTNLQYISDRELSGFSCYVGFLVSACTCN